ncbi:DUF6894 family protein [Mesorhizobium sp. P5_C1]
MALFYFDVNDNGHDFPDDQGTDCRDFDHVKEEAIRSLVELIGESLPDGDHHKLKIRARRWRPHRLASGAELRRRYPTS